MNSNDNSLPTPWTVRITAPILIIYLLLVLPAKNIFFYNNPWLFKNIDSIYFFLVILIALYKSNASLIGFSTKNLKSDLLIGSLLGGSILFILYILVSGMHSPSKENRKRHHTPLKERRRKKDTNNIFLCCVYVLYIFKDTNFYSLFVPVLCSCIFM